MLRRLLPLLALPLAACTCGAAPPSASSPAPAHARLTVTLETSGSLGGSITSTPPGIAQCRGTCTADMPRGTVTLTFVPDGAAPLAQFYVVRPGGQHENCGPHPAFAGERCAIQLDDDRTILVSPVSVPPPP